MDATLAVDLSKVAQELRLKTQQVETVVGLLDAENTIPFITRYRKDQTGGLDEEQIRLVQERVTLLRLLADRKQTILKSIESQGKLTPELSEQIQKAANLKLLEDLYLPFKPKKQTLATAARERGLEQLAQEILEANSLCENLDARAADFISDEKKVPTAADALLGAGHILAEQFSEHAALRGQLRTIMEKTGKLVSANTEEDAEKHKEFRDYFEYSEAIGKVPPHRVLAINRGERAKALKVKIDADVDQMIRVAEETLVPPEHPHKAFLLGCTCDALERLSLPSLEREVRREMTDKAEQHAVSVFAKNLRNLLLQPPIRHRRVLAIDPGFRSGCKLVALDEFGNLLDQGLAYLVGKDEKKAESRAKVAEMIRQHQLSVVAIGNGTACRETEELVAELIADELKDLDLAYVIVNEAGASVYSTSQLGREEFPDYDATLRGSISIGRRLQDPLSELVKINPQSIGVGLYQHDVKQKHLQSSLDDVVQSCVNYVGVELNTASVALLRYVSGLNQLTARRLVEFRQQIGPFKSREQLREVAGIGEVTYTQAAGFLQVVDGDQPLDATWIHPESYAAAQKLLENLGFTVADLKNKERNQELAEKLKELDLKALSETLEIGELTLRDVVANLARPGRDPREDLPKPIFKKGILRVEDLTPGMDLTGTVLNVVDFGAFVDIGLKDSGLVHISQMSDRFIKSPHEVVSVGDVVTVWVLGIDKDRRRLSLSMIDPAKKAEMDEQRQQQKERERKQAEERRAAAKARAESAKKRDEQRKTQAAARQNDNRRRERAQPAAPVRVAKPAKRAPAPPITEAMKKGKEPMRTFGDLFQFYDKPADPPPEPPAGDPPAEA